MRHKFKHFTNLTKSNFRSFQQARHEHYDYGTKYNFRLRFFPRSSSIWNSRGGDQRVEQQLSELAKSVLANNSSKSQSPIVITHLVRASTTHVDQSGKKCTLELTNGHSALPVYILCLPSCMYSRWCVREQNSKSGNRRYNNSSLIAGNALFLSYASSKWQKCLLNSPVGSNKLGHLQFWSIWWRLSSCQLC